jgi:adenosylcobinamide-phosphate synthase
VNRLARTLAGAAAGLVADQIFGEPPLDPHPVAAFGSAMGAVDDRLWADSRSRGTVQAAAGVSLGAGVGLVLGSSIAATGLATYLATAGHGLAAAATDVRRALDDDDLPRARELLPALVGRDPFGLDRTEIARAAVESVAENTVDGVVAPALWGAAAGAPGALGYRATNTLDSMVGHHSDRYENYGWASARLDDAANYLPARFTALLVAICRPLSARGVIRHVRRDASAHPSPNAGVAEAAFAAALGVRLGGTNRYGTGVDHRPLLGSGRRPCARDIDAAVLLSSDVTRLLAALLATKALALALIPAVTQPRRDGRGRA